MPSLCLLLASHSPPSCSPVTTCSKKRLASSTRRRWRLLQPWSPAPPLHHRRGLRFDHLFHLPPWVRRHLLRLPTRMSARTTIRSARPTITRSFRCRPQVAACLCRHGLRRSTHGPVSSRLGRCRSGSPPLRVFLARVQATLASLLSPRARSSPTVTSISKRRLGSWRHCKAFHRPTSTLVATTGSWTPAQVLTWKTTLVSSVPPLHPH
jgi:hypothetical protein